MCVSILVTEFQFCEKNNVHFHDRLKDLQKISMTDEYFNQNYYRTFKILELRCLKAKISFPLALGKSDINKFVTALDLPKYIVNIFGLYENGV